MADDLLMEFINESLEHLADIETDLLAVEEAGANVDMELVNKVFRAAHSIKGGSSFFALNSVKELAHKTETVLDMLRTKVMAPDPEITNVLLAAFDRLRELLLHTDTAGNADVSDLVVGLVKLAESYSSPLNRNAINTTVTFNAEAKSTPVDIPLVDLQRVRRARQYVYVVKLDLVHDVERTGKTVLEIFKDMDATGEVLDCRIDFDAIGTLDGELSKKLPLQLYFATVMDPMVVNGLFDIADEGLVKIFDPRDPPLPGEIVAPTEEVAITEPIIQQTKATEPEIASENEVNMPVEAMEPAAVKETRSKAMIDETIRVNVNLLELLMNLAGELVLGRNQLRTAVGTQDQQALVIADQRVSQVTSELQNAIMQTRLQPVGNVFSKFPRVVRDTSIQLGKEIELEIIGKEVALDRSMIEGLSDPLTHMVRNSVDHGIETPDIRAKSGKPRVGNVRIEAMHEAGQVVIEIGDDGKGIDPKVIADSAVRKGLLSADKVAGMSDADKVALIFLPGLSTAEKLTDISGRGVGMDVVKTNIDRLGGTVEISSKVGEGTLFRIKLPLTLAIIPSLIVSVEDELFALPQINIVELLRIPAEEVKRRIEVVGGAEVLLLRDRIIPLVRFGELLGIAPTYIDPKTGKREIDRRLLSADRRSPKQTIDGQVEGGEPPAGAKSWTRKTDGRRGNVSSMLDIAVLTTGTQEMAVVVGRFHDTEEIVVKPLGVHLKALHEYAGATILGNGTVALIVDVGGLAAKADLASVSGSARAKARAASADLVDTSHTMLLFHNTPDEICAVPLDVVRRIEHIAPEAVETKGGKRTMKYRGASLPLVTLSDAANVGTVPSDAELAVIVTSVADREIGLLGAMPVDVVTSEMNIDTETHRQPGIAGSTLIRDNTTLLVDLFDLVDSVYPEWRRPKTVRPQTIVLPGEGSNEPQSVAASQPTVLLAEDSDFFRSQIKRYLEEDGWKVYAGVDGEDAWEILLEHVGEVNAVVTDIEMPRLDGLGLSARIRKDERTKHLRILALTSLAGEEDIKRGKDIGIDDYQVKLDRDRLLDGLHKLASAGVR